MGGATENRVAILRPALTGEEAEAGLFQLREEAGAPDPDAYTLPQPEVAAAVPIRLPGRQWPPLRGLKASVRLGTQRSSQAHTRSFSESFGSVAKGLDPP